MAQLKIGPRFCDCTQHSCKLTTHLIIRQALHEWKNSQNYVDPYNSTTLRDADPSLGKPGLPDVEFDGGCYSEHFSQQEELKSAA